MITSPDVRRDDGAGSTFSAAVVPMAPLTREALRHLHFARELCRSYGDEVAIDMLDRAEAALTPGSGQRQANDR